MKVVVDVLEKRLASSPDDPGWMTADPGVDRI